MVPTLTIAFPAPAEVEPHTIVRLTGTGTEVARAAATAGHAIIGVADAMGAPAGGMLDVHMGGTAAVRLGGTVAAGQALASNATGRAIASVAAAGRRILGYALEPGVNGDIIKVRIAPGFHSA